MILKPRVEKSTGNEWEFILPDDFYGEKTLEQYTAAIGMLNTDDVFSEIILKQIIKEHPYFLDAYNHLSVAFRNQEKEFESYLVAEKVYRLGKECFPKEFKIKTARLSWQITNNRPYLRACHLYGLELQFNEEFDKAIEVYNEMLQLNPLDNQGARHLKLECLFALEDYSAARDLLDSYPVEHTISFAYGKLLLAILDEDHKSAAQLLVDAIAVNPYLPAEIVKKRHTPPAGFLEEEMPAGSLHEAFEYWTDYIDIYTQQPIIDFFESTKKIWATKKK
ncbi:transcriptional repressor TCF25 [Chitinophaga dinghuensis]|uniref:Transcriptional repressor TCF25 n=1 Tax=Chitinophaga dinghuensis TaxID=1539050 RepID=A0A327WEW6_9BACT|nr:tetratricopeptide repeat protein [Chitinophaga dinghuensis]RAJ88101.1 transcriptional repressor TCF25 [Chitinophaga dinghuensis]